MLAPAETVDYAPYCNNDITSLLHLDIYLTATEQPTRTSGGHRGVNRRFCLPGSFILNSHRYHFDAR